jgi:hypothetical protein
MSSFKKSNIAFLIIPFIHFNLLTNVLDTIETHRLISSISSVHWTCRQMLCYVTPCPGHNCCYFVKREPKGLKGVEVLTAVSMRRPISLDITPCSPFKIKRHFGGICKFHLQGRRISSERSQLERSWLLQISLPPAFNISLFDLLLDSSQTPVTFKGLYGTVPQETGLCQPKISHRIAAWNSQPRGHGFSQCLAFTFPVLPLIREWGDWRCVMLAAWLASVARVYTTRRLPSGPRQRYCKLRLTCCFNYSTRHLSPNRVRVY